MIFKLIQITIDFQITMKSLVADMADKLIQELMYISSENKDILYFYIELGTCSSILTFHSHKANNNSFHPAQILIVQRRANGVKNVVPKSISVQRWGLAAQMELSALPA